jgi:hypothetical protein
MHEKLSIADLQNRLELRHYKNDYTPAREDLVLVIGGKKVGTLQNFVTFTGHAKSGKSTYLAGTIARALSFDAKIKSIDLVLPEKRRKLCLFDTEQSEHDFYSSLNKIKNMAKIETLPQWFNAYAVREDDADVIKQMIEVYLINNPDCSVLIIDGLLDLIHTFNDEIIAKQLIQWLKFITKKYNILVIGVIHLTKKDNNTLGHLGSALDRYSQSVVEITKDVESGTMVMQPRLMRSDLEFDAVAIKYNNGDYVECLPPAILPTNKKR